MFVFHYWRLNLALHMLGKCSSHPHPQLHIIPFLFWQGFRLARRVFYCLSHTSSPFALVILEIGSCFLPRPAWTSILLFYISQGSCDDRCVSPCPTFFTEMGCHGSATTIFPISPSHIDWNDRYVPLYPAMS
jgi:hypothetical protein